MPLAWRTIVAVTILASLSLCQEATNAPPKIRWNWKQSQELSWRQSISRNTTISPAERKLLIDAIGEQLRSTIDSGDKLKNLAEDSAIEFVDLNGDGSKEVIVQGNGKLCSPTGNCAFWVLRRSKGRYEVILDDEAKTFTIQPERTNGFNNLVLTRHGSAFSSDGKEFCFSDGQYRQTGSFAIEWSKDANKAPKLTRE